MSVETRYHRRPRPSVTGGRIGLLALLLLGPLAVAAGGCRKPPPGRAKIAVSIFPVYDLIRRVAAEDADVVLVLPSGISPHGYRPGPDQVKALAGTRLGIAVGLGLDAWLDTALAEASPKARVVRVGDRVPTLPNLPTGEAAAKDDDDNEADPDPHVWLDPQRTRLLVKAAVEEMARADASHANVFRRRAADVDASLEALDHELDAATRAFSHHALVTFHSDFAYFAERYRLDVVGVVEPSPGVPANEAHLAELAAAARARGVTAIFREPQFVSIPAEALAKKVSLPLGTLDPLGPPAPAGSAGEVSYESLLRANVGALAAAMR